jgi:hypothetical protein
MDIRCLFVAFVAAGVVGCSPPPSPPETNAAPAAAAAQAAPSLLDSLEGAIALTAAEGASGALTLTHTAVTDATAEGGDPLVTVQLQAADARVLSGQEANHTPADLMAQGAGGVLAVALGLPSGAVPHFYRVTTPVPGAPLLCGPQGPASFALAEDGSGGLVVAGLTVAGFDRVANADGTEGVAPLPADAVCERAVYRLPS